MSNLLSGVIIKLLGRWAPIYAWPIVTLGVSADGTTPIPLTLNADGTLPAPGAPAATSTKTPIAATGAGTIPTGTLAVQFMAGTGATGVTVDGIPLAAGQSMFYPPSAKLHAAITYTITGGTLYGYYEV